MDQIATYIESKMSSRLKNINIRAPELSAQFEGESLCDLYLTKAIGDEEIELDLITIEKFRNGKELKLTL